jgi:hypothetical protein
LVGINSVRVDLDCIVVLWIVILELVIFYVDIYLHVVIVHRKLKLKIYFLLVIVHRKFNLKI